MKALIHYFIKHSVITNWIMLLICFAGIFALFNIQRRIDPRFEIEEIEVYVPYPGASAIEVEEGIVIKIEERLRGMEGILEIRSSSTDGGASINIEMAPDYDMNKALQKVKNAVNSINSYPTGAEKPVISQEEQWTRGIMFSIYGPDDLFTLKKIVTEFRDDLLRTDEVSNVQIWGLPGREIVIHVSPLDLERYKLTIDDISNAIQNANINISSGSVVTDREQILIRSYNKSYYVDGLENIEIVSTVDGQKVLLSDIAQIVEQWPENVFYSENNGKKAVAFNVMYNNSQDVVEIVETAEQLAKEYQEKYDGLVHFDTFIRETDQLEERIDLMTQNGLLGLVLVLVMLGIFLNLRMSFWVALGIPVALLGMFFTIWVLGISINQYSLFGMIMVVGILVDDGIVISESIYTQWQEFGKKPIQAAIDGTLDVIKPVMISILTTIVAFVPYYFFYGYMGKYVWQMATVVIVSLLFSIIEAVIILPAHLSHSRALHHHASVSSLKPVQKGLDRASKGLQNFYSKVLKLSLTNRWAISALVVTTILIMIGLYQGGYIRSQFFPELEPPYANLEVVLPAGTSAQVADRLRDDLVNKVQAFAKEWQQKTNSNIYPIRNYNSWMGREGITLFFVLPGADERDYTIGEFSDALSEYIGDVPEAENIITGGYSFGGSPVNVRFTSPHMEQLHKAKDLLKEALRNIDGVRDIRDDTPLGSNEFVVELKPEGKALGFTLLDLTRQLRQGFYGEEVMRLQRGRDEVKIWVRFDKKHRMAVSQIENLKVRTPGGEFVPFKKVADYHIERGINRIRHENGERSVTVFADLDYDKNDLGVVLQELNSKIIPDILTQVEGVNRSYGGQAEEVSKMVNSVKYSFSIAFVVMFTILMFLLKSYMQTILVMTLIPLGLVGATIGHLILGLPLSIVSFLGAIALAGIIINDSVVLLDKYNKLLKSGVDVEKALLEAGNTRFRPIILTTITTAAGLAPMILLKSEQGQFLVPMAVSVAFGLLFGTFVTLVMLPSALYVISDLRKLIRPQKSRLDLEPAYKVEYVNMDV